MPRDLLLRKRIKIKESTQKEISEIFSEKFDRVQKPDHKKGLFSIILDGKLIGWGQISQSGKVGEIERIEVLPKYESKGIGRKVLGKLTAILIKRRVHEIIGYGDRKSNYFHEKTNLKKVNNGPKLKAQFRRVK